MTESTVEAEEMSFDAACGFWHRRIREATLAFYYIPILGTLLHKRGISFLQQLLLIPLCYVMSAWLDLEKALEME